MHLDQHIYIGGFVPQFCQVSHSTLQLKASEHCIALEDQ